MGSLSYYSNNHNNNTTYSYSTFPLEPKAFYKSDLIFDNWGHLKDYFNNASSGVRMEARLWSTRYPPLDLWKPLVFVCASLRHLGCRGWAPGADGCPWLWHQGSDTLGVEQDALQFRSTRKLLWGAGLQAGTASPSWKVCLKADPGGGMDSTPPLGDAPFQVIGVMCPREGWKCWCTQGLLAGETRLNPPELCTAGGCAGKFLCLGLYVCAIYHIH